jgi:uncharacterized protein YifN (PemK superfamily)
MVLICDFAGFKAPEMVKARPVVIVSPNHLVRPGLVTVVPLSTTPPQPIQPYHHRLKGSPIPGNAVDEVWAKCDMICTVSVRRIDRVKVDRGKYVVGHISMEQVNAIRVAAASSFGLTPVPS